MSYGFSVDAAVLLGGVLLIVGVVASGLTSRFRVPSLLLFLGLGMIVADDGLGIVRFDDAALAQNIAAVALVVILFEGGLGTDRDAFRSVGVPAGALASVGVVITALVIGGFVTAVLGWSFADALLLGSVVASTDAAAVFAALRTESLPRRTMRLLQLESGMNDPVAVLMPVGMVEVWRADPNVADWTVFLVRQLGGGVAVGVVVGMLGRRFLDSNAATVASSAAVLTLAIAGVAYGVAAVGGASGFLAVYLTGVVLASAERKVRGVLLFHESLASTAQGVLFLLLGILVFPSELIDDLVVSIPVAIVLVVVARPVAVVAVLAWSRTSIRRMAVISWAGLRGAVPVVLATIPFTAGHPKGSVIFDVTFVVVVLSVGVQAPTVGRLARWLRVDEPVDVVVSPEVVPVDSIDAELLELTIPGDSRLVGRTLGSSPPPADARIVLIRRNGETIVPSGSTRLLAEDHLLVVGPRTGQISDIELWTGV